ncbi:MAG: hypothetical protein ACI9CD_000557 [Candidatus Deianiraeaceae bacterium]|jgi:hypothetical protein
MSEYAVTKDGRFTKDEHYRKNYLKQRELRQFSKFTGTEDLNMKERLTPCKNAPAMSNVSIS